MYLMTPTDVEQELLRLHQFKKLHYQVGRQHRRARSPARERPAIRRGAGGMSINDPMTTRLTKDLEPILSMPDPRPKISAYHDMPYALFHYSPRGEFTLRKELDMLDTRLSRQGQARHPHLARRVPR